MASDMVLYWASGSPPCWRVMITLEEKGLQGYESKLLSFDKKEHKSEDVLKINPRGQVPSFKHGDNVVNESLAICHYLEDTFKEKGTKLFPDDPKSKAAVLQRLHEVSVLAKKGSDELLYYLMGFKEGSEELLVTKKKNFSDELQLWEGYLEQAGASSHIATKDFSMADASLFPSLAFYVRMGLNLDSRPNLKRYYETVKQRPSVQASWPPHWKNTPNSDKIADV